MIKIKICDVAPKGACSYYRGIGPLQKLYKLNRNINVEYTDKMSWNILNDCDILFLMRPVEDNYIETLNLAKDYGVKIWIDFDDLLHEIPEDNPNFPYFTEKKIISNFEYAIKNADIVTVSTEYLKEYYQKFNKNITVVENAFNDYNFKFNQRSNDSKYITWRGSDTHRKDLLSCVNGIHESALNHPDWTWLFIGCDPWYITEGIRNHMIVSELEIIKYNNFLSKVSPSVHIVPLVDSPFNRAKSNISWIEGTMMAGAVCVAPDLPEFQKPGVLNYKDESSFKYLVEKSIKSKSFRNEKYNESFSYIQENLLLSEINKKRIKIIEENI